MLFIELDSKEIDGVPVTGTPVGSRTAFREVDNPAGEHILSF